MYNCNLKLIGTLSGHNDRVWNVAWSPDGSLLASCGADKTIRLWSLQGEEWVCKAILTDGHQRTVRSLTWAPNGQLLASTSFDATTCIWDRRSGQFECIATLEGHENEVKCAAWAPSGNLLATCSRDKSVWIWEVDDDFEFECASVLNSHSQDVKKVVWHPNKEILASASYDNTIKLYHEDADDWSCFVTLKSHESTVWSLAFDHSGTRLASCGDDRTVKIWKEGSSSEEASKATWKCVCTLSGYHNRTIYDISWCQHTGAIATACGDDTIRVFKESTSESDLDVVSFVLVTSVAKGHTQDVNCVAWNPVRPGMLASCSDDESIKLWQYNEELFPAGWLALPIFFYFPFGLVLALVRCFIGLHTFLVACLLPKTIAVRSFILRTMCYVLGIVVHEGDTKHKNTDAKVLVMNHVTVLDHLAVDLVLPCTVPSVWDLPKVLTWCLGYKDLGVKQGRDVLIENVRKHCTESDLKILVHPEGATTNGRVGLLKFGTWPFCVGENVLPVLLDVRRLRLLNIAPSVIGSRWWSDLFWFLFSPCTIFTIRYLPAVQRSDGASDEEFSAQVSQTMATSLNVDATNFTCADKVEFVKRILFQRQQQEQQHNSASRHATTSSGVSLHTIMAHQVKEVLPYVPLDVIKRDLLSTNSVSLTISNILEGAVHYVPETEVVVSTPATSSLTSSFSNEGKIEEPLTDDQYYTALNTAASCFGKTAEERTMSYQERKRRLIEMSRRRYMQKHALS